MTESVGVNLNLNEGGRLEWSGRVIEIGKRIGEGLTSDVYRATLDGEQIVVKALKEASSDVVKNFFMSEAPNVQNFVKHWNSLYPESLAITPKYHGGDANTNPPFLLFEFIAGREISQQVAEHGPLSEERAFSLGNQMGQMFVVLHEAQKKTYADIKYENFWIVETDNPASPQLKVTDWNVLRDIDEKGVANDLFYASLYLYAMLTGVMPRFSMGQLSDSVNQASAFSTLTVGTQMFLRRALQHNLARRYQTAKEWQLAIQELDGYWKRPPAFLNLEANKLKTQGKALKEKGDLREAGVQFQRAVILLEISSKKGKGDEKIWEPVWKETQEELQRASQLQTGKTFFDGTNYEGAVKVFDEGADISPTDAEALRRWYWLAHAAYEAGRDRFLPVKDRSVDGLEALLNGSYEKAEGLLSDVCSEFGNTPPSGLKALWAESRIYSLDLQAIKARREGRYSEAKEIYQAARDLRRELPSKPPTNWVESVGDLNDLVQRINEEDRTIGEARVQLERAQAALEKQDWNAAGQHFRSASMAAPDQDFPGVAWAQAVEHYFRRGELTTAMQLAEGALGLAGAKGKVSTYYLMGHSLNLMRSLAGRGEFENMVTRLKNYQAQYQGDNEIALGAAFRGKIEEIHKIAQSQESIDVVTAIIDVARLVDAEWASEVEHEGQQFQSGMADRRQTMIDELYSRSLDAYTQNTLEAVTKAHNIAVHLRSLVPAEHPRSESINRLVADTKTALEVLEARTQKQTAANDKEIVQIKQEMAFLGKEIKGRSVALKKSATTALGEPATAEELTGVALNISDYVRMLSLAYQWQNLEPTTQDSIAAIDNILAELSRYGEHGWRTIYQTAEKKLHDLKIQNENARKEFEAGNLEEALALMTALNHITGPDTEFLQLARKLGQADSMLKWADGLKALAPVEVDEFSNPPNATWEKYTHMLGGWLEAGFPKVYWVESKLRETLESLREHYFKVLQKENNPTGSGFLGAVVAIIYVQRALRLVRQGLGEKISINSKIELKNVLQAAYAYLASKKGRRWKRLLAKIDEFPAKAAMPADLGEFNIGLIAKQAQRRKIKRWAWIGISGLTLLTCLIVLAVNWKAVVDVFVPATATHTPTATEAPPSATPEPTPEPTEVFTPTPFPISQYLVSDEVLEALPALPFGLSNVHILDDTDAVFIPEDSTLWKEYPSVGRPQDPAAGMNGAFVFVDQPVTADAPHSVTWVMDVPLQPGIYELFAMDPGYRSVSNNPVTGALNYSVYANGVLLEPLVGQSVVQQQAENVLNQDRWASLGIYYLATPAEVMVQLNLVGFEGAAGAREAGIDAIAIAKLRQPDADFHNQIAHPTLQESVVLHWIDDVEYAVRTPDEGWVSVPNAVDNWDGASGIQVQPGQPAEITLDLGHPLLPGSYQIWTWLPTNSEVALQYILLLDGVAQAPVRVDPVAEGRLGTFLPLANLMIDKPTRVSIRIASQPGVSGLMVVDVVVVFIELPEMLAPFGEGPDLEPAVTEESGQELPENDGELPTTTPTATE